MDADGDLVSEIVRVRELVAENDRDAEDVAVADSEMVDDCDTVEVLDEVADCDLDTLDEGDMVADRLILGETDPVLEWVTDIDLDLDVEGDLDIVRVKDFVRVAVVAAQS